MTDCGHDTCNKPNIDHRHTVMLVDGNDEHRQQTLHSLLSFYNCVEYRSTFYVLAELQTVRPGVVLVDEDVPSQGGYELVRLMRMNPQLRHIPVILVLSNDNPKKLSAAIECGATAWLVKPYLRSVLIRRISDLLNSRVEKQWDLLPEIQSRTLKGTVATFNDIADTIANGEPIAYAEVKNVCTPLVEAVNSNNFIGILNGVKNHDNYTYVHSLRVATMLTLFGHAIQLPPHEQVILATGGLLHDIGKMSIPYNVLNKPGKLTPDEFEVMKSHVTETIRCLELDNGIPRGIITIAGQHHEKLDGTGYPYGLEGTQLNDLARMAAIVDIFSALTDRRVYKPPMPAEEALALMTEQMSRHIDTALLSKFRENFLDALRTF